MTDTTDQQAVTRDDALEFADEAFRNRDITFSHRDIVDMTGALDTFLRRHHLASVSSASADLPDIEAEGERVAADTWKHPSGMYLWTDMVGAIQAAIADERARHTPEPVPATNQVGEVERLREALRRCSEIVERHLYRQHEKVEDVKHIVAAALATQPATSQEGEACICGGAYTMCADGHAVNCPASYQRAAYLAMTAATPTPLSATSQENGVRSIIQNLLKAIPLYWAMSETDKSAVRAARSFVATQPATSQGGERTGRLKYYPDYIDDPDGLERFRRAVRSNDGHDMADVNYNSLGRLIDTIERLRRERDAALAATPTPPTLSEDLREALTTIAEGCVVVIENGDAWPSPLGARHSQEIARAALAQVKAS